MNDEDFRKLGQTYPSFLENLRPNWASPDSVQEAMRKNLRQQLKQESIQMILNYLKDETDEAIFLE